MKAIISYSKKFINYDTENVEMEFTGINETKTFTDEYGTHSVKLVKIIEHPSNKKTGSAIYRIVFENGNVYEDIAVIGKTNDGNKKNEISAYQVAWVEFRATKGIVTKADAKILLRSMLINSKHGTRVHEPFANMDAAKAYVGTIDASKLTKNYEVRFFYDKQFELAKVEGKDVIVPFTEKQENEMFAI